MKLANSSERWGAVSQLLHWLIVALVLTQVTLAYLAADLPVGLQKLALLARHKSFGITILGLALIRLAWRLASPGPEVPTNLRPLERLLARVDARGSVCLPVPDAVVRLADVVGEEVLGKLVRARATAGPGGAQ